MKKQRSIKKLIVYRETISKLNSIVAGHGVTRTSMGGKPHTQQITCRITCHSKGGGDCCFIGDP